MCIYIDCMASTLLNFNELIEWDPRTSATPLKVPKLDRKHLLVILQTDNCSKITWVITAKVLDAGDYLCHHVISFLVIPSYQLIKANYAEVNKDQTGFQPVICVPLMLSVDAWYIAERRDRSY